jgi:hypothetical protein
LNVIYAVVEDQDIPEFHVEKKMFVQNGIAVVIPLEVLDDVEFAR